jgi:hypothetical protein
MICDFCETETGILIDLPVTNGYTREQEIAHVCPECYDAHTTILDDGFQLEEPDESGLWQMPGADQ